MINLLPHNEELFNKILNAMFNGHHKIFYSEATGLGKSYIFMKLVEELFTGKRILYVVPKVAIWSNLTSYSEFKTLNADITMVTFSSFNSIRNDYKDWDCVFVDECHHMLSDIQGANVNKFLDNVVKYGGYAFGLTATPKYHGLFVDECFFPVSCYGLDIFEAIEQGLLPKIKLAVADINLDEVPQDLRAKYTITGSKSVLDRVIADNYSITHWLAYFYTVEDLEKAEYELSLLFPDYKVFKVHSELENNVKTVNDFSEYKGKAIMLSVSMLLEGLHVRNVGGVLLYRNVVTVSTYMQIYGRLCTLNTKDTPIFVDISNSIFQLQDLYVFKSSRALIPHKRNLRDIFDVTANSYWTVELYDYLKSLQSSIKTYRGVSWTSINSLSKALYKSPDAVRLQYIKFKENSSNPEGDVIDFYLKDSTYEEYIQDGYVGFYKCEGYKYKDFVDLAKQLNTTVTYSSWKFSYVKGNTEKSSVSAYIDYFTHKGDVKMYRGVNITTITDAAKYFGKISATASSWLASNKGCNLTDWVDFMLSKYEVYRGVRLASFRTIAEDLNIEEHFVEKHSTNDRKVFVDFCLDKLGKTYKGILLSFPEAVRTSLHLTSKQWAAYSNNYFQHPEVVIDAIYSLQYREAIPVNVNVLSKQLNRASKFIYSRLESGLSYNAIIDEAYQLEQDRGKCSEVYAKEIAIRRKQLGYI